MRDGVHQVQWMSLMAGMLLGLILGWTGSGWAQKEAVPNPPETQTLVPSKTLDEIYRKLEEVQEQARRYGGRATQILEKMDLVLQNQEEMKKELNVIRVRSSR